MEFLDLNLSEVTTDTINNLSDISFSTNTSQNKQDGGFFSLFSGSSKIDKAVLDAVKEKNFAVVEFMIDKGLISSYGTQDKDGNTLLHYLVSVSNPNIKLIEKITDRSDAKSFVNKQNKDGDTPLILAVKSGHHDLCSALIEAGANKSIKNKSGLHVDTETEEIFGKPSLDVEPLSKSSPLFEFMVSPKQVGEILEPLKKLFNRNKQQMTLSSEPGSIQLTETQQRSSNDTEEFIKKLQQQMNVSGVNEQENKLPQDTEETINRLNKFIGENKQTGGSCNTCGNQDTENLVTAIENYFATGGAKRTAQKTKKSVGTRKVKSYLEAAIPATRGTDLSRVINNQTTEIINRVIKTIQTIINDNKSDFKGIKSDEDTARAIKAIIWKSLRDTDPDKPALDIAVEMEKVVTKDYIKKIKSKEIKEMMDTLHKHVEEKKQKQQQKDDTISSTSSENVPSETNLSNTSF